MLDHFYNSKDSSKNNNLVSAVEEKQRPKFINFLIVLGVSVFETFEERAGFFALRGVFLQKKFIFQSIQSQKSLWA